MQLQHALDVLLPEIKNQVHYFSIPQQKAAGVLLQYLSYTIKWLVAMGEGKPKNLCWCWEFRKESQ